MILLTFLVAIFGYGILALGLLGILYKHVIVFYSLLFTGIAFHLLKREKIRFPSIIEKTDKLEKFLIVVIILQMLINLIGVLGPETSFDALWYHLTLPKIYLISHTISHIGGVLYYSDMPRLTEMIYTAALAFGDESLAKFIHYGFGVLTCLALYVFSLRYLEKKYSLLATLIFYTNLVVGSESTIAYIDLARTFFEFMAFWTFLRWIDEKEERYFYYSAIILGIAISTKLLALGSVGVFAVLIMIESIWNEKSLVFVVKRVFSFSFLALLIPSPWFVLSFLANGQPFFPFLSTLYKIDSGGYGSLNIFRFVSDSWMVLTQADDPISPLYLIVLPLVFFIWKYFSKVLKIATLYVIISFLFWYVIPKVGGGRFLLPYLPVWSFVVGSIIAMLFKQQLVTKFFRVVLIVLITLVVFTSLFYRLAANAKYVPYFLGKESKDDYLTKHLNFSFGDFYDTDKFFKQNISSEDKVLLYGFHNLYYVNFPFVDSTFVKKGERFNYIAVQNEQLPPRFKDWNLIYTNPITHVTLYTTGGMKWVY